MRKTKIICSLGPACTSEESILSLAKAGMNIARINMSHGTESEHQELINNLSVAKKEYDVKLMIDTKGPEIRIGKFFGGKTILHDGKTFVLTTNDILGDENSVSLAYKNLVNEITVGKKIFANNGLVLLKVTSVEPDKIITKVIHGGMLSNNKGLNIPNLAPTNKYLSEADKQDILFAIKNEVDYLAISFVSCAQDVLDIQKFIDDNGGKNIKIIAKIENAFGVKNIDSILKQCHGVMVARGDLGAEINMEKIPAIQKKIISTCNINQKFVIVATEMLESMIKYPRPTRAEVSDVANAVYDEANALMLSGETSVGKYPLMATKMMAKVIDETEKHIYGAKI